MHTYNPLGDLTDTGTIYIAPNEPQAIPNSAGMSRDTGKRGVAKAFSGVLPS